MIELVCIVCPNGCPLTAEKTADGVTVTGNKCPRGKTFAEEELTAPKRSVTGTVATAFAELPVVSVRTKGEIPKERIFELTRFMRSLCLTRAYGAGEVIATDVLGTGVDLIVTTDMHKIVEG